MAKFLVLLSAAVAVGCAAEQACDSETATCSFEASGKSGSVMLQTTEASIGSPLKLKVGALETDMGMVKSKVQSLEAAIGITYHGESAGAAAALAQRAVQPSLLSLDASTEEGQPAMLYAPTQEALGGGEHRQDAAPVYPSYIQSGTIKTRVTTLEKDVSDMKSRITNLENEVNGRGSGSGLVFLEEASVSHSKTKAKTETKTSTKKTSTKTDAEAKHEEMNDDQQVNDIVDLATQQRQQQEQQKIVYQQQQYQYQQRQMQQQLGDVSLKGRINSMEGTIDDLKTRVVGLEHTVLGTQVEAGEAAFEQGGRR